MRRTTHLLGSTVFALSLSVSAASASTISLFSDTANSTSGLGSFTGSLSYDDAAGSDASGTLTLNLTNTSGGGGYLTALVMNLPISAGTSVTGVSLSSAPANFSLIGGPAFNNGIGAQPFGAFDFGASTSATFLGGGNPNLGLASGQSGSWTFTLTGSGLNNLSVWDFVNALSSNTQGQGPEFILTRFRGFRLGGSDKVPGDPGKHEVPEPTAMLLLGGGLAAFAHARRRARAARVSE